MDLFNNAMRVSERVIETGIGFGFRDIKIESELTVFIVGLSEKWVTKKGSVSE